MFITIALCTIHTGDNTMIEGANCYECGRCNGGDVCRNPDTYYNTERKAPRKTGITSWLLRDTGLIGVMVKNNEASEGLAVGTPAAIALVLDLVRNIEHSYRTTSADKARLLAAITKLLSEYGE